MLEKIGKSVIVLTCVFISSALAVEKPTSPQKTCVTEECHADYSKKAWVHGPVGLGDCKSCHKPLDSNEHTYQFVRKGKDLCEYCHLEQTAKKNIHEPYYHFADGPEKYFDESDYCDSECIIEEDCGWRWTLGEIISALIKAGLTIEFLHEFPYCVYQVWPTMVKDGDWLESQGIDRQRMKAIGKGETNFIVSNKTAKGRAKNRRIELVFSK